MNLLFDYDGEVEMSTSLIQNELLIEDALSLYQTTLIYYAEAKKQGKTSNAPELQSRIRRSRQGLNALLDRLIHELGEDRALLFAAKSDLEIKLNLN